MICPHCGRCSACGQPQPTVYPYWPNSYPTAPVVPGTITIWSGQADGTSQTNDEPRSGSEGSSIGTEDPDTKWNR